MISTLIILHVKYSEHSRYFNFVLVICILLFYGNIHVDICLLIYFLYILLSPSYKILSIYLLKKLSQHK